MELIKTKKIRDTAYSVGFSESSLRNYERHGIINPQKSESGYRYFNLYDISRIMTCRKYRQYGFSFPEIVDMMDHSSLEDLQKNFRGQEKSLRKQFIWNDCILRDLQNTYHAVEQFQKNEGVMFFENRPEMFYVEAMISIASITITHKKAIKQLTDLIPITKVTARSIYNEGIWKEIESGFSIFVEEAELLELHNKMDYLYMPAKECITAYICCTSDKQYMTETLPAMQSFAQNRGYRSLEKAIMQTYVCFGDGQNIQAYRKVWLEIEK